MTPDVYIITYCRRPDLFYGTELIFKTLRVGFPSASVIVTDNASDERVRPRIVELARKAGCQHHQLDSEVEHHWLMERITMASRQERPLVFLDPDIMFWESCEEWSFPDALLAGRLMPRFYDEYTRCLTEQRLHTSFWWVENPARLIQAIRNVRGVYPDFRPLSPIMIPGKPWQRFDTGSLLFAALPDQMQPFVEAELSSYDHLFCGSHLDWVENSFAEPSRSLLLGWHEKAKGDFSQLRGIWRQQEEYLTGRIAKAS